MRTDKYITKEMIEQGLSRGIIKPILETDGLRCYIGEHWFWFGGNEFEYADPKDIERDVLIDEIKTVLDGFYQDYITYDFEYLYYYYFLKENL